MRPLARAGLQAAVAASLLAGGFALVLALMLLLGLANGSIDPRAWPQARLLAGTYARVVLAKGLLPQLALALVLAPLLEGLVPRPLRRALLGRSAVTIGAAALAYALIAPLLLTAAFPGWPALELRTPAQQLGSASLMIAAVAAAVALARRLVFRERGRER